MHKDPAMFDLVPAEILIEHDQPLTDEGCRMSGISCRVNKSGPVAYLNWAALEIR